MGDNNRVVLDSSKALKAIDELIAKVKTLVGLHEELGKTLTTAYVNDNLLFYSKMAKQADNYRDSLEKVVLIFEKVSQGVVEHANGSKKISENY